MSGYLISVDRRVFDGWRDGRPFTLADAFAEVRGVGGAAIYRPDGSPLLTNAGAMSVRAALRGRLRRCDGTARRTLAEHYQPRPRRNLP